ncbi:MAG: NUDIX hydrolase [Planctomycetota bacterium]
MSDLVGIEVVEDRTARTRSDEGFLRLRRYTLRNVFADGTVSDGYPCDVVSRRCEDAVAVVLYDRGRQGEPRVALRTCLRPPVLLRREKGLEDDDPERLLLTEVVAGILEHEDAGPDGIEARAATESREEAGYDVDPDAVTNLGAPLFPSPGTSDEKVFFRAVATDLEDRSEPTGDGSVMEAEGSVVVLPLREAIRRCRDGEFADMKSEVALLRLCDRIGYVPALDRFLDELPEGIREEARALPPLLPEA